MIQITPNFVIGLPDISGYEKFIEESNQRRLVAIQEIGMNVTEYSDDDWLKFKKLR